MRRPNLVEEEIVIKILESKLKIDKSCIFFFTADQERSLTAEEKKTMKKLKTAIEKSLKKLEWCLDGYEVACQQLFDYAEEAYMRANQKSET